MCSDLIMNRNRNPHISFILTENRLGAAAMVPTFTLCGVRLVL